MDSRTKSSTTETSNSRQTFGKHFSQNSESRANSQQRSTRKPTDKPRDSTRRSNNTSDASLTTNKTTGYHCSRWHSSHTTARSTQPRDTRHSTRTTELNPRFSSSHETTTNSRS